VFPSVVQTCSLCAVARYATQQAEQEMMKNLSEGNDVILSTIPFEEKFSPGDEVHFKIGIKKNASVDDYKLFTLCIGEIGGTKCEIPSEMKYVTVGRSGVGFGFINATKILNRGDIKLLAAIMDIPNNIKQDLYGFRIYVCPVKNETQFCNGLQEFYGYYDLIIEVKLDSDSNSLCNYLSAILLAATLIIFAIFLWIKQKTIKN
jgi:hypothetical protein